MAKTSAAERLSDPFERRLFRVLEGLRRHCGPDAYRLDPGEGSEPDAWIARCPLHPDAGFSMVVREDGAVWCRIGCPSSLIRSILVCDPEREALAVARAKTLVWAQSWERTAA